jgi:poly-gamma-glutamate capsule biosynthesis protein CapA/YwtB (metallophosphatase superfamily)
VRVGRRVWVVALLAALTAPAGSAAPTPPASSLVSITAVGDMALGPTSSGPDSLYAGVRDDLHGDIVFGNLEGTLTERGSSKCGPKSTECFAFRAPPSYAGALRRAGFDLVNLANNHALDFGEVGQADTVAALDRVGLAHTGRPGEIAYLHGHGLTVAVLGFAPYSWAQSLLKIAAAQRLIRHASEAADLVVVTIHAGAEGSAYQHVRPGEETFLGEDRGNAVAFSHAAVEAGADLVVGSGPHVLRGLEWYRGRLIAYSMGNFVGDGTLAIDGPGGISAVLQVTLRRDGSWGRGSLRPVRLVSPGLPIDDADGTAVALMRDLSSEDFGKRAVRVTRTGTLVPPR